MGELLSMAIALQGQYMFPFVLALMAILLSESIMGLIFNTLSSRRNRR